MNITYNEYDNFSRALDVVLSAYTQNYIEREREKCMYNIHKLEDGKYLVGKTETDQFDWMESNQRLGEILYSITYALGNHIKLRYEMEQYYKRLEGTGLTVPGYQDQEEAFYGVMRNVVSTSYI